ncbi:MAG TPA: sigma-70 family RNA polymerase sigma factor [Chthoniobacteraceae bacterium]|nr:sigma-70 family RNA polymerase sigma factor [Chthoniobacteraceae bacterium]
MSIGPEERGPAAPGDLFATTRWTMVLKAQGDSTLAQTALAELCQAYWFPLYAYVRRRGYGAHDAEDLTQGFFARLLRLESLGGVRRERGRFRAFLLASMKHYLADERDRASARKRAAEKNVSLDAGLAEHRYGRETTDPLTPERLFERQWALALLESVLQRLAGEYEAAGKTALFDELRFALTGDRSDVPYATLAGRLGMSEEAVRVAVHRLRHRYRRLLRHEVAQTVENASEVADELAALRRILSS